MAPSPYNIFCIGVIWFHQLIYITFCFFKLKIKQFIHFIKLSYLSFLYESEKDFFSHINKLETIKYPNNIAIVLNKFLITENKILSALCNFIKWILLTNKIKYLTIYDAFNLVNIQKLINEINENITNNKNFKDNIRIHISYKDNKNGKIIEKKLEFFKKSENPVCIFYFYICFIGFKEANNDLINKIVKEKKPKIYGNYPDVYKWFDKDNKNNYNDKKVDKEFKKYLTRKNEISLPELIITFGKNKYLFYEDICLYGFPFTLLENCEIININHKQIDQIDILDFTDIFIKNNKIIKRFGE